MGNLVLLMKLKAWWDNFVALLKGEVAPADPVADALTVQMLLNKLGYYTLVTGVLDEQTRVQLRLFQNEKHLEIDGLFGPQTWKALRDATASRP